ncbi:MAG: MnhB domain-containing protein [Thermomicrobiales bacterium]
MTVMTRAVARLLLMPSWMIAAAVLVKGYTDTGDGFSAGVIAALGVLIQFLAFGPEATADLPPVRFAREITLTGLLLSLAVAFLPVLWGEAPMTHFPRPGEEVTHFGTLEILTAVVFDIGVCLLVFGFMLGVVDLIARLSMRMEPTERER